MPHTSFQDIHSATMNTISAAPTSSNTSIVTKSAWTFTSAAMDDSVHSEAQQVLDKWTDDDDFMMMDTDDDCLPGIVSESDSSESSSSSSSSSDMDDILMMKLDDDDGLLMDDLLADDDDLKMLENVLSSTSEDDIVVHVNDAMSPSSSSPSAQQHNQFTSYPSRAQSQSNASTAGRRWSTASNSPDAFFSSSALQGTTTTTSSPSQATTVLDQRLQQTVRKLQESMKRSSETRQSLYARSSALSNYRRTHSVRQVLNNVEYTSKGVARSFSDPTPLSHMQNTLMR